MRYELTDHGWAAIKPMLPNKPRGVREEAQRGWKGTEIHAALAIRSTAPPRSFPLMILQAREPP